MRQVYQAKNTKLPPQFGILCKNVERSKCGGCLCPNFITGSKRYLRIGIKKTVVLNGRNKLSDRV